MVRVSPADAYAGFIDAVPAQAAPASCIDINALKGRESISGDSRPSVSPAVLSNGGLLDAPVGLETSVRAWRRVLGRPLFGDEPGDNFGEHLRNAGCGCRAGRASLTLPVALARGLRRAGRTAGAHRWRRRCSLPGLSAGIEGGYGLGEQGAVDAGECRRCLRWRARAPPATL